MECLDVEWTAFSSLTILSELESSSRNNHYWYDPLAPTRSLAQRHSFPLVEPVVKVCCTSVVACVKSPSHILMTNLILHPNIDGSAPF